MNAATVRLGVLVIVASFWSIAAQADGCSAIIPAALQAVLEERHPEFRLPRPADSDSLCVVDRRRKGQSDCMLVASGDFDGDERADFALLMPSRKTGRASQLVVALERPTGWELERPWNHEGPRYIAKHELRALDPGRYRETEAVVAPGKTARSLQAEHDGFLIATCDSAEWAYFRIGESWQTVTLTD